MVFIEVHALRILGKYSQSNTDVYFGMFKNDSTRHILQIHEGYNTLVKLQLHKQRKKKFKKKTYFWNDF